MTAIKKKMKELTKSEKEWRKRFEYSAHTFKTDSDISRWTKHGLDRRVKVILREFEKLEFPKNSKILDAGCGPGTYCKILGKNYKVLGIDFSKKMIQIAKKKTKNKNVEYRVASVYKIPCKNAVFDAILCSGVFQSLENPNTALAEFRRVLKKGGILLLDTLVAPPYKQIDFGKDKTKKYNLWILRKNILNAGFEKVKTKTIWIMPENLKYMEPVLEMLDSLKINQLIAHTVLFIAKK